MALIDQIEMLGQSVSDGYMSEADAAQLLQEYSDGGLTKTGATDLIRTHRTARRRYEGVFSNSRAALKRLRKS